jgi:uncharacterized protein
MAHASLIRPHQHCPKQSFARPLIGFILSRLVHNVRPPEVLFLKRPLRLAAILTCIAAAVYLVLVGCVWWIQDSLVFQPTRGYADLPESRGLKHEDVALAIANNVTVRGWFVHALGAPQATILYLHGNGGDLSSYLTDISQLAKAGFDSLSIDYEGYGESSGHPSEANTYRDAAAAWSWLTTQRGVPSEHLAIWGFSLGGAVATQLAETYTPGALVLQSTFTSLPDVGALRFYWLPAHLITHNFFASLERMSKIHAPVFIAHSRTDKIVPFEMGRRLFAVANEPKVFRELTGGHINGLAATPSIWNDVLKFFTEAGVIEARADDTQW